MEKKTAEEAEEIIMMHSPVPNAGYKDSWIIDAMRQYSNQQLAEYKAKLLFQIDEELEKEEKAASIPMSYVHPTMYYVALQRVSKLIDSLT
jgi:hypothetical protein